MTDLTYLQAAVVGLVQGVSELFPISSLGHAVLIPAVIGGQWAQNLNVAAESSPYLAFIVGLHVATAAALLIYFWQDWVRIIRGLITSIRYREVYTADERLAWMIVLGTIPVGIAGVALQKTFQTVFGQPKLAAVFLTLNGLILIAVGRHSAGPRAERQREHAAVAMSDGRLASLSFPQAMLIGSAQCLALIAGISRDGVAMVAGMTHGLSREDAGRFAFLLATPAILAAGVLKLPELFGPAGAGIGGQVLVGSLLAGLGAYFSVRFLVKYLRTRTLTPFGIYCIVAGLGSLAYLTIFQ